MTYTTATPVGEIIAPIMQKVRRRLKKTLDEDSTSYNAVSQRIESLYTDRIERERNYCKNCEGLSKCQYTRLGNTGFRPIWSQWSPIYIYVKECHYKRAQSTAARIERLFSSSGIPVRYKDLRLRDLKASPAVLAALKLIQNETTGLYVYGNVEERQALVSATGNELILQNVDVLYTTCVSLLTHLRVGNPDYYAKLQLLTQAPVLIVDDIDVKLNDYREEQLGMILEERTRNGRKLIVTGPDPKRLNVGVKLSEHLKQLPIVTT